MTVRDLIDLNEMSVEDWQRILKLAEEIYQNPDRYIASLNGKIMATLFYEPSTRTQMSFQAAMMRLGGQVIGFKSPANSSVTKGENLKDTIKIVSGYSDILVIRHPFEGSARAASLYSQCPVINAGDGGHLHPTQTLTDLFTLMRVKGRLDDLKIGLCGDLKFGRTVHSLLRAMAQFKGNKFYLISTPELAVPQYLLDETGAEVVFCNSIEECIGELDMLYMTRVQRERFASMEEYERLKGAYILDADKMKLAGKDTVIMHPLPRVDEIDRAVDDDPRALYFKQAEYGMYARMALIMLMINEADAPRRDYEISKEEILCTNTKCILTQEPYMGQRKTESGRCAFCEGEIK